MTDGNGEERSADSNAGWIGVVIALVAIAAIGFWLVGQRDEALPGSATPEQSADATPSEPPGAGAPEPEPEPEAVKAPAVVIEDKGRLKVVLASLQEGEVAAVGLAMPDDARGDAPLETRVIDATRERVIDLEAIPISGEGAGVRLEIDPEWLEPGQYLIQVRTAEKSHFPVRRYVLEVE